MVLLILLSLFVLVYTFILCRDDDHEIIYSTIVSIFLSILVFLIIGAVVYGISETFVSEEDVVTEKTETQKLISLEDKSVAQGRFILGTGKINNDDYYYYVAEKDKGYKTDKVSIDNCYIRYTNDNPRIEKYFGKTFKNWFMWIYAMPAKRYYIIYVPEGTIIMNYCIDLK